MYKTMKVFQTSDMPADVSRFIRDRDIFVFDGFTDYVIGYYTKEARENNEDMEDYVKALETDEWLVNNGGVMGERVLIEDTGEGLGLA